MVSHKLKSIWKIIIARQYIVIVETRKGFTSTGAGNTDMEGLLLMAVTLKQQYDGLVDTAEKEATDSGQLHALIEMKQAIEKLEKKYESIRDN